MSRKKDPLSGPFGIIGKFIGSTIFGGLVSLALFLFAMWFKIYIFFDRPWIHVLWIIPVVWGIIGIFYFDIMLDTARRIFNWFFGINENY